MTSTLPSPEQHKRLIHKMAAKVVRRLYAAGARVIDKGEVEQELWMAWTIARSTFDTEKGVPFAAYFARGAWNHINGWFRDFERQELRIVGISLDDKLGEDEGSFHDTIADDAVSIEDELARQQRRDLTLKRLSPVARKFVELLEHPPAALYAEIDAFKARQAWAKQRGKWASPTPSGVTVAMIADLMCLSKAERRQVYAELNKFAAQHRG